MLTGCERLCFGVLLWVLRVVGLGVTVDDCGVACRVMLIVLVYAGTVWFLCWLCGLFDLVGYGLIVVVSFGCDGLFYLFWVVIMGFVIVASECAAVVC